MGRRLHCHVKRQRGDRLIRRLSGHILRGRHKVESSAQQRPGVKWGLVASGSHKMAKVDKPEDYTFEVEALVAGSKDDEKN